MTQTAKPETTDAPQATPATVNEIESSCPGISPEKTLQYMKEQKTLNQCRNAWMHELATENAAVKEEIAVFKDKEASAKKRPGVEALKEEGNPKASSSSPTESFWAAVKEIEGEGRSRVEALSEMNRMNPELRQAMLAEQSAVNIDN